ncbi:MAG: hypothetical protein ACREBU_23925 [Nitrososphaera sp.]
MTEDGIDKLSPAYFLTDAGGWQIGEYSSILIVDASDGLDYVVINMTSNDEENAVFFNNLRTHFIVAE